MHPKPKSRWLRLWGLVVVAGLVGAIAYAQQPMPKPDSAKLDPKTGAIIVPVGGLVQFDPKLEKGQIPTDVLVSREDIVGVRLDQMNPQILLLTGKIPGLAQVKITVKDRPVLVYDVVVQPDYALLRQLIQRTLPTSNIEVTPGLGNVVILSGYVTTPQEADNAVRLASSQVGNINNIINAIQIGGVQQVQIDVVVASVDRNEIRERGFDFLIGGSTVKFTSLVSGLIGPQALGAGTAAITPGSNANLALGIAPAQFFAALQALRTEGIAKFLGEPRVVTQTGRPAFFQAGGRQAVLGPASGINGPGVQFEQVGTILEVLPIVYGNGQIWLELNPTVRAVNQGLGIQTVFGFTPGFTENQMRCAVMLESGQTFAIGGLIQNSVQAANTKVPVAGDLPFVGTLFSHIRYEERESELIILVTPRLVHPMDCNQVPRRLPGRETRAPDDYELFLENIFEAPRGQRKVWTNRCYNAAYKCDPSIGTFPCIGNVCNGQAGGGSCGTTGCATGTPAVVPGNTAPAGPAPAVPMPRGSGGAPGLLPESLPANPSTSGTEASAMGPPALAPIPPVIVVPETPRN